MAGMMPSSNTTSGNPYEHYDDDALERDQMIDPDDGTSRPNSGSQ